jgi:hypothetical protein
MPNAQCSKSTSVVKLNEILHLYLRDNEVYMDMERLEIWKTFEVARHLLQSTAHSKLNSMAKVLTLGTMFSLVPACNAPK